MQHDGRLDTEARSQYRARTESVKRPLHDLLCRFGRQLRVEGVNVVFHRRVFGRANYKVSYHDDVCLVIKKTE